MTYNEKMTEYDRSFWNHIRGKEDVSDRLESGCCRDTGGYELPSSADEQFSKAIGRESVMRGICSVHANYGGSSHAFLTNHDDIAEFVPEFGSIDITDVADDFTRIEIGRYKLAVLLRLPCEFVSDAAFDLEHYLIKRLGESFAGAEDKAFITGTGTNEPTGILHATKGADVGKTTSSLTYDDVVSLYFSVKPKYRKKGVWLMNDNTAMVLRKMKDENGAYIWNSTNDTIFGKSVVISEYMPDIATGNKPIAFGDFSYYWIVKRSRASVRMLWELFVEHGQNGYLANEFIDGRLIRTEAVKVLKVTA